MISENGAQISDGTGAYKHLMLTLTQSYNVSDLQDVKLYMRDATTTRNVGFRLDLLDDAFDIVRSSSGITDSNHKFQMKRDDTISNDTNFHNHFTMDE